VLLAWGTDDRLFPIADAHRLAAVLPDARVEEIAGARTLPMIDRPERLAELIGELAEAPQRSAAGQAIR
jgi:pimeloyl-ACP methyl ester carboxylesterase